MILATVALATICALPATAAAYAGFDSWRGRKRNDAGLCARCAGPQYAAPAYGAPSLVQGRMMCAPCADRLRTRTRIALLAAGALSVTAVAATAMAAALSTGGWLLPVVVAGEYCAMFGGAVAWMKRRNRAAARELPAAPYHPLNHPAPAPGSRAFPLR
jgi:hypothetical protein